MKLGETFSSKEGRGLLDFLEIPLRRPLHLIVPTLLVVGLAGAASFVVTKRYKAWAVLLIETEDVPAAFAAKASYNWDARRLSNVRQDVKSRTRLDTVIQELDPYPELTGEVPASRVVEEMREAISVEFVANDTFTIEFVHKDPRLAAAVPNRLAALLIEGAAQQQTRQAAGANEFVETQLEEARRGLEIKEQAVRQYKEAHVNALPEQLPANLMALQRLEQELQSLDNSLRLARERQGQAEKGLENPAARAASGAPGTDPALDLNQLRSQLVALRGRYTAEHPDVVTLQMRIERLEKLLAQGAGASASVDPATTAVRARLEQGRAEVADLEARRAEVQRQIAAVQARLDSIPAAEQEIAGLSRDLAQLRENYAALLAKKLEVGMAERLKERWSGDRFRVMDPAHVPDVESYPNRLMFLLIGAAVGLMVGGVACAAAEWLDHSITSIAELESAVPYPVLAAIPHVGAGQTGWRGLFARVRRV